MSKRVKRAAMLIDAMHNLSRKHERLERGAKDFEVLVLDSHASRSGSKAPKTAHTAKVSKS